MTVCFNGPVTLVAQQPGAQLIGRFEPVCGLIAFDNANNAGNTPTERSQSTVRLFRSGTSQQPARRLRVNQRRTACIRSYGGQARHNLGLEQCNGPGRGTDADRMGMLPPDT